MIVYEGIVLCFLYANIILFNKIKYKFNKILILLKAVFK